MTKHPEWIDRRNGKRTVPMQVLGLGFSRTGTSSLEMLGYVQTNHGRHVFANPFEMDMWIEAMNARFDWDRMLGHCQAVADMPHFLFSQNVIEAYPDSKVILTLRDPDSWWKSIEATGVTVPKVMRLFTVAFFGEVDPQADEAETAKVRFLAHYDEFGSLVPKERLLEFDVKEGWEPLCKFLGKAVPDTPFPRINETQMFQQALAQEKAVILRKIFKRYVLPGIVLVVSAIIGWQNLG
ncbi:P-loop containing nucleoside triphosphate hydrolase protein [Mycena leptocephala]|nr:P-loop containing nucleoside triphosphate hydrolase protein [Mycena leptocephala]